VNWASPVAPEFHFVARTIDLVLRAVGKEGPGFSLALAPSPLARDGAKLGLGSSAARWCSPPRPRGTRSTRGSTR